MADTPQTSKTPSFFSSEVGYSKRFYFDLAPPKHRLAVICGGLECCSENYAVHRQDGFQFLCLEYVLQGSGTLSINAINHELSAGSVFAYGPGVPIEIVGNAKHPMTKYFICFVGRGATESLALAKLGSGSISEVSPSFALASLFEEVIEAGLHGGRAGETLCISLLKSLLVKLSMTAVPHSDTKSNAFLTFQRCRRYGEERFLRLRTLDDFAEKCRIDPSYLCRLFQTYGHETPYRFLLRLKVHHAATLLQHSGMSVKEAGLAVGFADQMHFSRVFRKILKVPPTTLRAIR
jgi:AraC-like DNA-binding protein